jgi:hypothetical protein
VALKALSDNQMCAALGRWGWTINCESEYDDDGPYGKCTGYNLTLIKGDRKERFFHRWRSKVLEEALRKLAPLELFLLPVTVEPDLFYDI